jgi:FkbM family methyltransferase
VKVGAYDGISGDPCSAILLEDRRWRGLLIEPVPHCFDLLRANFADAGRFTLERLAIGAVAGEAPLYYVHPEARQSLPDLPAWVDQLGSLDRDHIVRHLDGALAPFIVACVVDVRPLAEVLRNRGIRDVHLLHVDTEGRDFEVLETLDFATHAPLAIFVEHKHLPASLKGRMLRLLRKRGYGVEDCGNDYFALDKRAYRRLRRRAGRQRPETSPGSPS